jgi:uncharacterized protein (DUF1501 family)
MIADTAREAYHGGDVLRAEVAGYTPAVTYPTDGFSQQLKLAAQLIGTNTGTKIVFVSIGSFDTHAGQRAQQDRLLGYLGNGLLAFYKDLAAHGNDKRVLTMTFSSNGDHPSLTDLDHNGNLKFATDFRAGYATVIQRWLGTDPSPILDGRYEPLAFV